MTADLGTAAVSTGTLPTPRVRPAVTVLAPLISPQECTDLERPEAATVEVFDAVTRGSNGGRHQLLPVRMRRQPGPYESSTRRRVEMLDATTLEDVGAVLSQGVSQLVHAVGWEAGVVAAALRSGGATGTRVVLEPVGPPGSPEWTLAEHAAALLVQSEAHRRESLRHGLPEALVHVVPLASPTCREVVGWSDNGGRVLGVVGDGVDPVLLESVEVLLRRDPGLHVVFAGEAARHVRRRQLSVMVRGWPRTLSARLHAGSRVTWQMLARVDAVLDVSTVAASPRAAVAATAAGRCLVAVAQRPAAELVRPGHNGIVVAGTEQARLTTALLELLGAPRELSTMGARARDQWETVNSPSARAERLTQVYDAVCGGARN